MSAQINITRMAAEMKKKRLWLTVIFGAALGLTFQQEVLTKLFPLESLRMEFTSWTAVIFFTAICFYFLHIVVPSRFSLLEKPQKQWVLLVGTIMPFILAIAILGKDYLNKTIYFLLPKHAVQITAPPESLQYGEDVILTGFNTQEQEGINFDSLELRGWERRGDHLFLTNPTNNLIAWEGKTDNKVSLKFWSRSDPLQIKILWDETEGNYNLFSKTPQNVEIHKKFGAPWYAGWITLAIAEYISSAFTLFCLSVLLVTFPGYAPIGILPNRSWLIYAMPMYAVWSFYLLVFWPGILTPDSMSQWDQVVTGQFIHANPVGHTLTMWLITRLWFSPAAVASVQILTLGGTLGWGIATLREYGYPQWLAWLTTIALAVSPANSTLSIVLWKDILFSVVVVALTILAFKVTASRGEWLTQRLAWVWLGLILTLVSLYRLNGFLVSFTTILTIGFLYRRHWKPTLKAAVLFLTVYFLFTGPLFDILKVKRVDMARDELVVAHLLAGHIKAKTSVVLENRQLLEPAAARYPWPYTCYRNGELFFASKLDRDYLVEKSDELLLLAIKATWQNPMKTLDHFACQADNVYRIPKGYPETLTDFGIVKNDYGLATRSLLPTLQDPLFELLWNYICNDNVTSWFVWRMPFWMYLSVFSCSIFCIRNKDWRPFLILLPGLLTVLPYLILTLGQIFRYLYGMYLIGILFSAYLMTGTFNKKLDNNTISN